MYLLDRIYLKLAEHVKHSTVHGIVFGFLSSGRRSVFFDSLFNSHWCSNCKSAWVSQKCLHGLSLFEGDVGDCGQSHAILHTINNGVRYRGNGWVTNLQGEGSDVPNTDQDMSLEILIRDVQDSRIENGTRIIDLVNNQTVCEGRDTQHVQEGCLGHTDLVSSSNQIHVVGDFNCTLCNLGRDVQSLEERGFFGTQSSILGGHHDIQRSKGTSLGGGLDLVSHKHVPDADQILLGEDETNVALDVVHQALQLGVVGQVSSDSLAHHGVLAHEYDSMTSKGHTDLLHLLGSDIVGFDQKALGIFVQELNDLGKVTGFPSTLVLPYHLEFVYKGIFLRIRGKNVCAVHKLINGKGPC